MMRHTVVYKQHLAARGTAVLTLAAIIVIATPLVGQTAGSSELQQLTAQLQQSPGDQALREQIIVLALTVSPKPATPDAVTMAEGAAEYAFKHAKAAADYSDSAKQYEKALLLAPWLAADYFNCGVAHEKAGENKEAIRNFSLYLLAAPGAEDAQVVRRRIGGLQYAAQKAEDEATKTAKEARAQQAAAPPDPVIERYECPMPQHERADSESLAFDLSTHRVTSTILWPGGKTLVFEEQFEESGQRLIVRGGCGGNPPDGCQWIDRTTKRLGMHSWGPNGGEAPPRGDHGWWGPYIVEYTCRSVR